MSRTLRSDFEVALEVGDETRLAWAPSKPLSRFVLEAGRSNAKKPASHAKCAAACSEDFETTGTFRRRPMTSAISLVGTPSSATPRNVAPAGPFSSASL